MQLREADSGQKKHTVFVTGATGVVGFHLVRQLGQAGHEIVAMVRRSSDTKALEDFIRNNIVKIRIVRGDLPGIDDFAAQIAPCDVLVHAAAVSILMAIQVIFIRSMSKALALCLMRRLGRVKHFVHISSLSVIMGDKDCFGITEAEPLRYCREAYANSKIEAEQLVMEYKDPGGMKVTALRPGFIYGPNERSWLPKLIAAMKARTAMLVGDGSKETNLIYVENLCRAIILSLMNPVAYGQIYNLTDGQCVTKRQLFDVICLGLGIPRIRIFIPLFAARFLVDVSSFLAMCAPTPLKSRMAVFSRPALRLAGLNQGFDISKAEKQLGYTDRIPFEEGMAKTLKSFADKESMVKGKFHRLGRPLELKG